MTSLAWGKKVSQTFRDRVFWIAEDLELDASDLMACMAFESGGTFRADIRNAAGSGAVGLIQFMPQTALMLGTTSEQLAAMSAEDQLNYVWKYLSPQKGRLNNLGDIYLSILWPAGIGKSDDWVLFAAGGARPKLYLQNKGLDTDHDGAVTRGETIAKVKAKLAEGMKPANLWTD